MSMEILPLLQESVLFTLIDLTVLYADQLDDAIRAALLKAEQRFGSLIEDFIKASCHINYQHS